jgi:hypothetical protein
LKPVMRSNQSIVQSPSKVSMMTFLPEEQQRA